MGWSAGDRGRGAAVEPGVVRPLEPADGDRLSALLRRTWGSTRMVSHGHLFDVLEQPGLVAMRRDDWLGHAVYSVANGELEVRLLEAVAPGGGVGSALLAACVNVALRRSLGRVWLVTTNDNVDALRFYQRRGFRLVALRPGAVDAARRELKPEIPERGAHDIPIRDEIELELPPEEWAGFVERYAWPSS